MQGKDVQNMIEDLDGGSLMDQLALALHEAAKSAVTHGGKRKANVKLEFSFDQIRGASQVMIDHKLTFKVLSAKGDVVETRMNQAPMHVTRTGVTSTPDGQMDFVQRQAVSAEEREV